MVSSRSVKLYAFDEVDERLDLVPLAARRALDCSGLKLSLDGWRSLPLERRRALVEEGATRSIDERKVAELVQGARPPAEKMAALVDPPFDLPPADLVESYGPERPVTPAVWTTLTPLDRYALSKVAAKRRPERIAAAWAQIVGARTLSTHLTAQGDVHMVDVASKAPTLRRAVAESAVEMNAEAFQRLAQANAEKGDVLATARLAGILAAKRTPELIPLCHAVALTHVAVAIGLEDDHHRARVTTTVESFDRTGVEMEAMVAASAAALTIYDMLKAYDRAMQIGPTRLLEKSGGRSGVFQR